RSGASQTGPGKPARTGAGHTWPGSAVVRTRIVIQAATPTTTHAPNRSSHRRTTRIGPPRASAVHTTATIASHIHLEENENNRMDIWFATSDIAQNSKPVHPTSCTMFSTDGTYEPRIPSTGRNRTMVGTASPAPAYATSASGDR